jgi:hypothetical protein
MRRSLLSAGVSLPVGFDAGCQRGLDDSRDDDNRQVRRCRRGKLRQRSQPPMRQPRRRRRELIETQHNERSGKVDTGRWMRILASVALPPTPSHPGQVGNFLEGSKKFSTASLGTDTSS